MAFSDRLKYERELRGWSQAKLAEELGVTPNRVSSWERGQALPSPYARQQLFTLLGKNAYELDLVPEATAEVDEPVLPVPPLARNVPALPKNSNRYRLLTKVHAFWIKGVLERSLSGVAHITLGIGETLAAVERPWREVMQEVNSTAPLSASGAQIIEIYDDASNELLILGEPGSGKTTLLLELTRSLLARAERDESHPIPVVFNLSSWAQKRLPLTSWLVEEMQSKYQVPRKLGQEWIENNQILPLLDGLDEVASEHFSVCIDAINAFRNDHGLVPIVVCCRREEYLAQSQRLLLQLAVIVQPLTADQIDAYLSRAGEPLVALRHALQQDPTLRELAGTPLMLAVLTQAYRDTVQQELPKTGALQSEKEQIFATYVQRMLARRGVQQRYSSQQTTSWLSWLARRLLQHSQTEFYLEQMQPDWLPKSSFSWHLLNRVLFGVIFGGLCGAGADAFGGLFVLNPYMPKYLGPALGYGLLAGALWSLIDRWKFEHPSVEKKLRIWPRVGRALLVFLVFGLTVAIGEGCFALILHDMTRFTDGLSNGLGLGIIGAAFVGVGQGRTFGPEIQPVEAVGWSWRQMWKNLGRHLRSGALMGLIVGAILGIVIGIIVGFFADIDLTKEATHGPMVFFIRLVVGAVSSLLAGLILGFLPLLFVGLMNGLVGGVSQKTLPERTRVRPNQGIWRSARNGLLVGFFSGLGVLIVVGGIMGVVYWGVARIALQVTSTPRIALSPLPLDDLLIGLFASSLIAVLVALASALANGGEAFLQHFILRFFLWRAGCLPWQYARFLDYAAERILLRKVGGGYIFVHRLLLEYFAKLE